MFFMGKDDNLGKNRWVVPGEASSRGKREQGGGRLQSRKTLDHWGNLGG